MGWLNLTTDESVERYSELVGRSADRFKLLVTAEFRGWWWVAVKPGQCFVHASAKCGCVRQSIDKLQVVLAKVWMGLSFFKWSCIPIFGWGCKSKTTWDLLIVVGVDLYLLIGCHISHDNFKKKTFSYKNLSCKIWKRLFIYLLKNWPYYCHLMPFSSSQMF